MNTFKRAGLLALAVLAFAAGCTKIETGHVGVRTTFNGQVEQLALAQGWHQTIIGDVRSYAANEITMELDKLHPQTKDRSTLSDLDLTYTYTVDPAEIPALKIKFQNRDMEIGHNQWLPAGQYVQNVMTTATTDAISKYNALEANEQREAIRADIKANVTKLLAEDGVQKWITVHQIFVKNLQIDPSLQASARQVITAQNDLRAKDYEVQTARKEAERLQMLAANHASIDYMNAKSLSDIAEGIKTGKVHSIVVPYDFKGIVNVK